VVTLTEFDLLITAHEVNDTLGLDLTPTQIARALEWHEHRTRPREGRQVYADPTANQALRNIA
jgi:hypothetical protein